LYLVLELALLFLGAPLALRFELVRVHPFILLWVIAALCLLALVADRSFPTRDLWHAGSMRAWWRPIVTRFVVLAGLMSVAAAVLTPDRLFGFVRAAPGVWALVMILYPVLSVYPQGIVYRAFFLHRYRTILPSPVLRLVASAVAFSLMHIVLQNPVAVSLTLPAGLMFAWTHHSSRSLLVSSFEHALYGCFIFTIGWGWYFYLGAVPTFSR
jgi:membrane protease YdiL (CAAX protease family)